SNSAVADSSLLKRLLIPEVDGPERVVGIPDRGPETTASERFLRVARHSPANAQRRAEQNRGLVCKYRGSRRLFFLSRRRRCESYRWRYRKEAKHEPDTVDSGDVFRHWLCLRPGRPDEVFDPRCGFVTQST